MHPSRCSLNLHAVFHPAVIRHIQGLAQSAGRLSIAVSLRQPEPFIGFELPVFASHLRSTARFHHVSAKAGSPNRNACTVHRTGSDRMHNYDFGQMPRRLLAVRIQPDSDLLDVTNCAVPEPCQESSLHSRPKRIVQDPWLLDQRNL
eukprot:SAG31_NODE_8949_length_1358_cov_1.184273_1_plen_146_part_10